MPDFSSPEASRPDFSATDAPEVYAAFGEFRRETLPRVRPAGLDPVRRTVRRRRSVRAFGAAMAAVVAIGVPAAVLHGGGEPVPASSAPVSYVPATSEPTRTPSAAVAGSACDLSTMDVVPGELQANASQPFVIVVLTNTAQQDCTLTGYPQLTDFRVQRGGRDVPGAKTSVTHGSLYAVPDPGSGRWRIPPGGTASFAVGTGTGYPGTIATLVAATLSLGGTEEITLNLPANGPSGQPIPVTVTAYARGSDAGR